MTINDSDNDYEYTQEKCIFNNRHFNHFNCECIFEYDYIYISMTYKKIQKYLTTHNITQHMQK